MKACPPAPRLIDGPEAAPVTVLLAHGAGAALDSPFMAAMASGLAMAGWRVVRFEFPPWPGCERRGDARGLTGCRCCRRRSASRCNWSKASGLRER